MHYVTLIRLLQLRFSNNPFQKWQMMSHCEPHKNENYFNMFQITEMDRILIFKAISKVLVQISKKLVVEGFKSHVAGKTQL